VLYFKTVKLMLEKRQIIYGQMTTVDTKHTTQNTNKRNTNPRARENVHMLTYDIVYQFRWWHYQSSKHTRNIV
jgi:hypothetical protein